MVPHFRIFDKYQYCVWFRLWWKGDCTTYLKWNICTLKNADLLKIPNQPWVVMFSKRFLMKNFWSAPFLGLVCNVNLNICEWTSCLEKWLSSGPVGQHPVCLWAHEFAGAQEGSYQLPTASLCWLAAILITWRPLCSPVLSHIERKPATWVTLTALVLGAQPWAVLPHSLFPSVVLHFVPPVLAVMFSVHNSHVLISFWRGALGEPAVSSGDHIGNFREGMGIPETHAASFLLVHNNPVCMSSSCPSRVSAFSFTPQCCCAWTYFPASCRLRKYWNNNLLSFLVERS